MTQLLKDYFMRLLLIWIIPLLIYLESSYLLLPKNSTVSDLISIYDSIEYPYFPPFGVIFIPVISAIALIISIIWFLFASFTKIFSNIKIK